MKETAESNKLQLRLSKKISDRGVNDRYSTLLTYMIISSA